VRCLTVEQSDSGLGLAAQRTAIEAEAKRRGWQLVDVLTDAGASGKTLVGREALTVALGAVESGQAEVLVVAKLDRLSRSLLDFASLMDRSRRKGWAIVAMDLGVDTTTPSGELLAALVATFAQYERRIIGVRTREALAEKKAAGVQLGRPPSVPRSIVARIQGLRTDGLSLRAIAQVLNTDGVATAHGGARWYAATVRQVLLSNARKRPDGSAAARQPQGHP